MVPGCRVGNHIRALHPTWLVCKSRALSQQCSNGRILARRLWVACTCRRRCCLRCSHHSNFEAWLRELHKITKQLALKVGLSLFQLPYPDRRIHCCPKTHTPRDRVHVLPNEVSAPRLGTCRQLQRYTTLFRLRLEGYLPSHTGQKAPLLHSGSQAAHHYTYSVSHVQVPPALLIRPTSYKALLGKSEHRQQPATCYRPHGPCAKREPLTWLGGRSARLRVRSSASYDRSEGSTVTHPS